MTKRARAMRMSAVAAAALVLAAAPAPPAADGGGGGGKGRTFISPMGEPFRADATGVAPEQRWFRGADRNSDGRLTLVEMRADAYRFFKTLDLNHDGEIDPTELLHYETDVAPEINLVDPLDAGDASDDSAADGKGDGSGDVPQVTTPHRRRSGGMGRGAGSHSYFDLPEPVAAADGDMNRGVSAQEFDAAAQKRFLLLDRTHDGYLSYDKLHQLRR